MSFFFYSAQLAAQQKGTRVQSRCGWVQNHGDPTLPPDEHVNNASAMQLCEYDATLAL